MLRGVAKKKKKKKKKKKIKNKRSSKLIGPKGKLSLAGGLAERQCRVVACSLTTELFTKV